MAEHRSFSSKVSVPTGKGYRYMLQLLKHWSHNLTVEIAGTSGSVAFPKDARGADWPDDGRIEMIARDAVLDVTVIGSTPTHREALKGAAQRHLDRFAFREAPLSFDWSDHEA
jgi:hypothetical protein